MKNMAIAFLLLFAWQSSAQMMVIHRSGLPDVRISIADIAKITFDSLGGTTGTIQPVTLNKMKSIMAHILPNPFSTKIEYSLDKPATVKIRVFDMQGKIVRQILNDKLDIGHYSTTWNSCNDAGQKVSRATYIVNIDVDGTSLSKHLFIVN